MIYSRVGIALAAGALLVSSCSSATAIESVNAALVGHYLVPLQSSGIGLTVENTCHLEFPSLPDEPWHLEVRVKIDADRERVADILEAGGVVIVRDRDPMHVQQEQGDPAHGWNGALESADEGTVLGLTYNNVTPGSLAEAGGWTEVCRAAG